MTRSSTKARSCREGAAWTCSSAWPTCSDCLGGSDEKPSRLRAWLQYALLGAVFLVGLVLPLVWVPYMAWAFRKSGLQMGRRATAFYRQKHTAETGVTVTAAPTVRIAMSAGLIRMGLLIAVPILVAVIALATGADIGSGKLLSAVILLLAVSAVVTLAWYGYRWLRRRHQRRVRAA